MSARTPAPDAPSAADVHRYVRQMLLPEVGRKGQEALGRSRVLCVGAGGLGSPAALYLAAAGVGTLGLADGDPVEISNLHRQVLHATPDIGFSKTSSAARKLGALNPGIVLREHPRLVSPAVHSVVREYDLVLDGSDNFDTRYLVNDACAAAAVPLVSGAVIKWEGQALTVLPGKSACYRCAFPEPPDPDCAESCSSAGVLGPAAGMVGCLMAAEALKVLLGLPDLLTDRLSLMDFKKMSFREKPLRRRRNCPACGSGAPQTRGSDK
jgi:molybdopterin-synthase adenylyltransferase